jgi:Mycoplasma protein of unknown function, DUF285
MDMMFNEATSFDQCLEGWDTSGVACFDCMFGTSDNFDFPIASMFQNNGRDLTARWKWDTSLATEFGRAYPRRNDLFANDSTFPELRSYFVLSSLGPRSSFGLHRLPYISRALAFRREREGARTREGR